MGVCPQDGVVSDPKFQKEALLKTLEQIRELHKATGPVHRSLTHARL